jgi:hypothetical protein
MKRRESKTDERTSRKIDSRRRRKSSYARQETSVKLPATTTKSTAKPIAIKKPPSSIQTQHNSVFKLNPILPLFMYLMPRSNSPPLIISEITFSSFDLSISRRNDKCN